MFFYVSDRRETALDNESFPYRWGLLLAKIPGTISNILNLYIFCNIFKMLHY